MTGLGQLVILVWVVLGVVLFRRYPTHRVVAALYVVGVLFLPEFGSADYIEGVPNPLSVFGIKLTKEAAISAGLLAGALLFDWRAWLAGRPRWFDLPMLAWCVGPLVTNLVNSLLYEDPVSQYVPAGGDAVGGAVALLVQSDLYDGLIRSLNVVFVWGVPYCLGRLYVTDAAKLRELVLWVVAGAVVYVPLCLLETVVSPQLHRWVYGFHQHDFLQSIRFNGYRPMVFLEHGLAVGFWMMAGTLTALWLWLAGPLREVSVRGKQFNGLWVVVPLCVTTLACKSTGAIVLGAVGVLVLGLARATRRPVPVVLILTIAPLYAFVRTEGSWDARELVEITRSTVGADRAQSLEFRLQNEDVLVAKALERPLAGWGGWGRARVYDEYGKAVTVADGMWVITLGERGLFGLLALGGILLLPVARLLAAHRTDPWVRPESAATAATAIVLGLFSIDCLLNSMLNPVFIVMAGALMGLPKGGAAGALPTGEQQPVSRVIPRRGETRVLGRLNHTSKSTVASRVTRLTGRTSRRLDRDE